VFLSWYKDYGRFFSNHLKLFFVGSAHGISHKFSFRLHHKAAGFVDNIRQPANNHSRILNAGKLRNQTAQMICCGIAVPLRREKFHTGLFDRPRWRDVGDEERLGGAFRRSIAASFVL
jgi:hypothetical protein